MGTTGTVHRHVDAFIVYWRGGLIAAAAVSGVLLALVLAPPLQPVMAWLGHPAAVVLAPVIAALALVPVTRVRIDRGGVTFHRYYGLVPSWRHRRDLAGHFQIHPGELEYEGIRIRCSRPAPIADRLEVERASFAAAAAV
jgi:hypothetical protein